MPARSNSRLSLFLLLIFASAAIWVWWPAQQDLDPSAAEDDIAEESLSAASELGFDASAETESGAIQRTEFVDPVIALTENIALGYAPERDILVRAELTLVEEERGHPPKDCEGWEVVAQTWIRETGEIARFEAVSDKNGIAEFHFPDFIHVDWVMCLPPKGSDYAVSFFEGHDDLGPEDDYLALLHVTEAKGAFGHVQDTLGNPIAGAVVHAYDRGWTYGLEDWTPGFLTTTTNQSGRFSFEQLTLGDWTFAVAPEQWLMIDPVHGNQNDSSGLIEIEEKTTETLNAGILKVLPMVVVELQVMGSHGTPAMGASLYLEPLTLDDDAVKAVVYADLSEEEKMEAMFSSDRSEVIEGLPYHFRFTSNREGKVMLRLLRGRYRMLPEALPGMREGDENPPYEFHTDQGRLTYQFHGPLSNIHGTVVGNDGSPMYQANVELIWPLDDDDNYANVDQSCGANGEFLFQSVRLGGAFEASVWPGTDTWLPMTKTLNAHDLKEDLELVLKPASKLLLDFEMEVQPDRVAHVAILNFTPREGEGFDPDDQWWRNCTNRTNHVNKRNRANLGWLQPGTYEVALLHTPVGYKPVKGVGPDMREIRRWVVETEFAWQELKVD